MSKGDRVSFRVTDKGRGPEAVDCKLENLEVGGVAVGEDDPGNDVDRDIRISKGLSQVLRHEAEKLGLSIRADGYVNVDEVLQCSRVAKLKVTVADVERVTRDSNKQRFQLLLGPDGHLLIRAVHGHSMKIVEDRELMRPLTADDADLPWHCVHGTYKRLLPDILKQGLRAGGRAGQASRNHVHFATRAPGGGRVVSGLRHDCEVAIWVDLRGALRGGVPFFMARNRVILSPGLEGGVVPSRFFLRVLDLSSKAELWPLEAAGAAESVGGESAGSGSGHLGGNHDISAGREWATENYRRGIGRERLKSALLEGGWCLRCADTVLSVSLGPSVGRASTGTTSKASSGSSPIVSEVSPLPDAMLMPPPSSVPGHRLDLRSRSQVAGANPAGPSLPSSSAGAPLVLQRRARAASCLAPTTSAPIATRCSADRRARASWRNCATTSSTSSRSLWLVDCSSQPRHCFYCALRLPSARAATPSDLCWRAGSGQVTDVLAIQWVSGNWQEIVRSALPNGWYSADRTLAATQG